MSTSTFLLTLGRSWLLVSTMFLAMVAEPAWAKPDLVVSNVVAADEVPVGKSFPVQYRIVNQGDQPALDVSVGVYVHYYPLADQSSPLVGAATIDVLQPGEARTVEILAAMPHDVYTNSIYFVSVLADYPHLIDEDDDGNNQHYAPVQPVEGTVCEADAFESDSIIADAHAIYLGDKRNHNNCDGSDDWVYLDAVAGQTYIITTSEGRNASLTLTLTDAAGNPLASGSVGTGKPTITWVAPAAGRYYVRSAPSWGVSRYTLSLLGPTADLVDTSTRYSFTTHAGALLRIKDGVENRGVVAAEPSEMGYYLSSDEFITTTDRLLDVRAIPGINAGGWAPLYAYGDGLVSVPPDLPPGSYWFGSVLDHDNRIVEFREFNNASRGVEIQVKSPPCTPDAFENDDFPARAVPTEAGVTSAHNFCDDITDWRSFEAVAGQVYVIETSGIGPRIAPIVTLYGPDAKTVIQSKTSEAGSSTNIHTVRIVWEAPADGRYYVNTTVSSSYDMGEGAHYSITIAPSVALPDLAVYTEGRNTGMEKLIAGGFGTLRLTVWNQGFADAGPSTVGIYLSPDWEVTTDDLLLKQIDVPALAQGASLYDNGIPPAWTYPATLPPGTYYLAAIADNTGRIREFSEVNNLAYPVEVIVSAPLCAPDAYEEDDFPEYAKPFQIGVPQAHNGCDDGIDYMYFDVTIGGIYSFAITDVGSNQDLILSVWDSTGYRQVWQFLYEGRPYETTLAVGRYRMQAHSRMGPNTAYTLNVNLVRKLRGGK